MGIKRAVDAASCRRSKGLASSPSQPCMSVHWAINTAALLSWFGSVLGLVLRAHATRSRYLYPCFFSGTQMVLSNFTVHELHHL